MLRRLSLLVLLLAAVLAAPAPAFAQAESATAEGDAKAAAKQHFDTGLALFKKGEFDPALAEFLESRRLFPTRSATKNAALALKELHRYDEAQAMFETLLSEFKDIPADELPLVRQEMSALKSLVGTIEVKTRVSGATVSIDGRTRGTTPLSKPVRVSSGTRYVRVFKQGYSVKESRVEVAGGRNAVVEVELEPLAQSGRLIVTEQTGKKADVLVDNVAVGTTPWEGDLVPGERVVVLRGAGKLGTQPVSTPVRVGQTARLALVLEELDSELRVEPTPVNGTVALDGVSLGRGPWQGRVRSGSHSVEVATEGFLPESRKVTAKAGSLQTVHVRLERDPSSPLWHRGTPPAFVLELRGGVAGAAGTLGSSLEKGCNGCDAALPLGAQGRFSAGYRFGGGLGLWFDAGYVFVRQRVENRVTQLSPQGLSPVSGVTDDELTLRGFTVGAAAGLQRGDNWTWTVRLGAGMMVGTLKDRRSGIFTNDQVATSPRFEVGPVAESPDARYLYVAPGASLGYKLGERFSIGVGLDFTALFALTQPKWNDDKRVLAGDCQGGATFPNCLGEASFGADDLTSKTVFLVSPGLELRQEFR